MFALTSASAEFMHPIVEKRPPLPSITRAVEPALFTAVTNDSDVALAMTTVGYTGRDGVRTPVRSHEEDVP